MKKSNFVRRLDPLGRIVLPKSFRDSLDISIKDDIEIFMDGTSIVVSKHEPRCVFCGETEGIRSYKDQMVCLECHNDLVGMK
ncbi:MAG: AbrB/MazE/SpoVT family DNA-binding domain-containing protein [Clostridia bacterium]|nr:AbrB/MazE/SpoVT family DNA-binding domain-containing protein [Clostridia bacterium]MBN2882684.1 AbrB/MazE/SpoVT family DNA-binding domain-containing protein [Clostridia bacterium]